MAPLEDSADDPALFAYGGTWQVLGPFQIGTREATWGADPLEYVGGFRNLSYDPKAIFRSSLPTNGTAKWQLLEAAPFSTGSESATASLSVSYSNVDWEFLKVVYGWAAVQYQAWARGELNIGGNETQHIILHTDAILEYWVDDKHYFGGDYYTYRRAPPVLHLEPGTHKIDLRLVRDVRAFGGVLEPTIDVTVHAQQVTGTLELAKLGILVSDVVDGTLASSVASISLRNSGVDDIEIVGIHPSNSTHSLPSTNETSTVIVAGQTRPVAFNATLPNHNVSSVSYDITYRTLNGTPKSTLHVSQNLTHTSIYKPHKVTYLHPGGMVSYAMLRPPAKNATCRTGQSKLPVLLALHGAGLEADSPMVTSALDPVSDLCAWVLFPTGVTPWSGDDWHNWGFADVEAAIAAIPTWINHTGWTGPEIQVSHWIVSGHSNGGQGTWYALAHRPDKIIAAAPVSGYASIQKYVPYELWQPADPRRTAVISGSLNSYRHEMLMANVKGIPIQQQHGEVDDNVPAYNSRFLAQQLYLSGAQSDYNEVPTQNHWWDTVMTTPELVNFYYSQTSNEVALPRKLDDFTLIVGDPGDMGSKGGLKVKLLHDPAQYGKVEVKGHMIRTTNVMSLELDPTIWRETVTINGQDLDLGQANTQSGAPLTISYIGTDRASVTEDHTAMIERSGRQLGFMTAILRTRGPFVIRRSTVSNTSQVALQISRNLHQYFQADTLILPSPDDPRIQNTTGNVITLVIGGGLPDLSSDFPIRVGKMSCFVRDHQGRRQEYGEAARGAAFLRPLHDERLELVIWGADEEGLRQAARVVPMMTGVGHPDFVIFGKSAKWRGIEGALAMGFFDWKWEVTASSVVETGRH
ncbi:hypothetical protein CC86DRAFT_293338 [Ophiobolus disseminans]|uniref:Peptidase S9 prolyl oligopeptidase catalytic domain-containing protein n=1 Tax=Ophiobolus disseminans TaxID=1469910 RepID=A0A6A7A0D1_9PLEO|nr:hypothetical protein CC86DRAFT_293338 [Ophiobolus disseminans]